MKYFIQHIHKKKYLIKILINIILLIFNNQNKQHNLAYAQNSYTNQIHTQNPTYKKDNKTTIKIQSDQSKFYLLDKKAYFLGDVIITYNNNTLYTDKISLYTKTKKNAETHTILSGIGNIYYNNNSIQITGKNIITDIQNNNIDLNHSNFCLTKQKIYGNAKQIKQRENTRYTIFKKTNLTPCPIEKIYWTIAGSHILYDHKKNTLNIWNVHFKIKNTPILYTPYLQFPLTHKKIGYYTPIPQFNNKYGAELKVPYYFNINKNCHGKITTNFIPKKGIKIKNHIKYYNNLNKTFINFDMINHRNSNKKKHYWLLHFKNNNTIQKKWHINNNYLKTNNNNYLYDIHSKYINTNNNYYIKKKISFQYTDTVWNIDLSHQELQPLNKYIENIYNTKPQLNINFHKNKYKSLNYHLFSQITQFKNINKNYPKTIRLHIEPSINILSNILNSHINTEIKLNTTYYQQNNTDYYNTIINKNNNIYLKKYVNRYIPQFKSNAMFTLQKKTDILNKYKQILQPQIQYLYIPYCNQKNIELYDTTIFQINHADLFENTLYSGLDRISSTNQITTKINSKIYNKNNNKIINTSLGQIYFFTSQKTGDNIEKLNMKKNKNNNIIWSATNTWKINKILKTYTSLQYDIKNKTIKSGNTIIEYHTKNNKILQINYRYLNLKNLSEITPEQMNPIYQKNITQIGIINNLPINTHWTLSNSYFYNTKNKKTINQTIGLQYHTCCWKISAGYERKINTFNNTTFNTKKYSNTLSLNLNLYTINQYSQIKKHNILYTNTLPYQKIL